MSKLNKAQKQEIRDREQDKAVMQRKLLASRIKVVTTLQTVNDQQAKLISNLRAEIDRLKRIDAALSDFNLEKQRKAIDDLADEGFENVLASRQPRRFPL